MATLLHQRRGGQKNAWRAPADKTKFDRKAMRFESAKRPFWNAPTDGDPNIVAGINPYVSAEDRESAHIEALKEFIEQFERDMHNSMKYFSVQSNVSNLTAKDVPQNKREEAVAAGVMIERDANGNDMNPFFRDPTDHMRYKESKKEVARYYKEKHKEDEEKSYRKCFEQWCIGKNFLLNDRRATPWAYETLADRFPRVVNYALQPVESTRKVHNYLFGLYMRSPQSEREIEIYFKYLVYPIHEALRKLQSINLNPDLTLDDLHAGDVGALVYDKHARKHNESYTIVDSEKDVNSAKYKRYWPPDLVFLGFGRKKGNKVPLSLDPCINRFMRPGIINAVSYKEYCEGDYSALSPDVRELWEFTNERMPGRDDRQIIPGAAGDTFAAAVGIAGEVPPRRVAREAGLCRPVLGRQLRKREEQRVEENARNGALQPPPRDPTANEDGSDPHPRPGPDEDEQLRRNQQIIQHQQQQTQQLQQQIQSSQQELQQIRAEVDQLVKRKEQVKQKQAAITAAPSSAPMEVVAAEQGVKRRAGDEGGQVAIRPRTDAEVAELTANATSDNAVHSDTEMEEVVASGSDSFHYPALPAPTADELQQLPAPPQQAVVPLTASPQPMDTASDSGSSTQPAQPAANPEATDVEMTDVERKEVSEYIHKALDTEDVDMEFMDKALVGPIDHKFDDSSNDEKPKDAKEYAAKYQAQMMKNIHSIRMNENVKKTPTFEESMGVLMMLQAVTEDKEFAQKMSAEWRAEFEKFVRFRYQQLGGTESFANGLEVGTKSALNYFISRVFKKGLYKETEREAFLNRHKRSPPSSPKQAKKRAKAADRADMSEGVGKKVPPLTPEQRKEQEKATKEAQDKIPGKGKKKQPPPQAKKANASASQSSM